MVLSKENYIHNKVSFTAQEILTLGTAKNIVKDVYKENISPRETEDRYLTNLCSYIIQSIDELLNDYTNEYAG